MNFCTASGLSSLGRALGLSQTTAYTPYLPLLALSIATKWFHLCQVNTHFGFITSDWFLILVAVLTVIDLIVDLIPAVSTGWHALHVAITPFIGGFVAAATTTGSLLPGTNVYTLPLPFQGTSTLALGMLHVHTGAFLTLDTNQTSVVSTIILFIIGFVQAGLLQLHRTGGRAVANVGHAFTLGLSNVVLSVVEDVASVIGILLSFFAPVFMLIIVVIVLLFVLATFRFIVRGWRYLKNRFTTQGSGA